MPSSTTTPAAPARRAATTSLEVSFPIDERSRDLDLDSAARDDARYLIVRAVAALDPSTLTAAERQYREAIISETQEG